MPVNGSMCYFSCFYGASPQYKPYSNEDTFESENNTWRTWVDMPVVSKFVSKGFLLQRYRDMPVVGWAYFILFSKAFSYLGRYARGGAMEFIFFQRLFYYI